MARKKKQTKISLEIRGIINNHEEGYTLDWAGHGYHAFTDEADLRSAIAAEIDDTIKAGIEPTCTPRFNEWILNIKVDIERVR